MTITQWGGALGLLVLLAGCTPQDKKQTAQASPAPASATTATDEDSVNLLASDPTQGFKDFKAVGTDGVTTPDCCKVPLPEVPGTKKTKA